VLDVRAKLTEKGSVSLPQVLKDRLRLPVIGAPLFIVSQPDLVLAQCRAGIVGSFPALNARPPSLLDEWLARITEDLAAHDAAHPDAPSAPFAVNQIVHRSNDRLEHDLELCIKYRVPIVITSLGAREDVNQAVRAYGGIVLHDIIHVTHARKAVAKGADGLIAVCAGAGGHAGRLSPFALVQEIRAWWDGPLALAGAIANGRSVLAAQAMGADLAYVGSPFISTREAQASEDYKQAIVEATAADIVYTSLFTGVHGNYLRASIERAGLDPDNLPEAEATKMSFGSGGDAPAKAWRDIWGCGQGIGAIERVQPAADLIARLAHEYDEARRALCAGRNHVRSAPGA
jgi:nitronate monooxygenase